MSQLHKKHPKVSTLNRAFYHQNEFGIYGTNCGAITDFTLQVQKELSKYSSIYVDADHNSDNQKSVRQHREKQFHHTSNFELFEQDDILESNSADVAFVNGNHYPASNQIVIINPAKEESLKRRAEQLDRIFMVLVEQGADEIFPFVKDRMDKDTVVLRKNELRKIVQAIDSKIEIPKVKALILAGGKSVRMGEDKTKIAYHGKAQFAHLKELCEDLGLETYVSRSVTYDDDADHVIKDRMHDMGPFGAIVSAFMKDRNSAWLVLASDMPFIDKKSIQDIISQRSSLHFATSYKVDENAFPEPTFSIYEPKIYKRMLDFLSLGYTCPRKVLINSSVKLIIPTDKNVLRNVNTKEEKEAVLKTLQ